MPDESGAISLALVLTLWCVALRGLLATLVWMRSRPDGDPRPAPIPIRSGRR
jgi:hypothetical protein